MEHIAFSIGGSHKLYQRQRTKMEAQNLKGYSCGAVALGSKRIRFAVEVSPETKDATIAFMRSIGATLARR